MEPRSWVMYAYKTRNGDYYFIQSDMRPFKYTGSDKPVHRVRVTINPEGEYKGWIATKNPERLYMVERAAIFDIQFPYGSKAAEKAGQGKSYVVCITDEPEG